MHLDFYGVESKVVCCYMSDNGSVHKGDGFDEYLPIVSEFEFKDTTDIKLVYDGNVDKNISSYITNAHSKNLDDNVKKIKKIDVTPNDINIGGTQLIFNFTDINIVVYNSNNIPHMIVPLDNKVLKEKYRGKILLMNIHRLNNPNIVNDVYNNTNSKNYLEVLKDSVRFKKNINNKYDEFSKVIDFAIMSWNNTDYFSNDFKCNSIKVVTMSYVTVDKLMDENNDSCKSIVLTNRGLLITRDTMFTYRENPHINNEVDLSQFKKDILPGTKFIYIVDNDNKLDDRYFNLHGKTSIVPKFKSKNQQINGLYVMAVNENYLVEVDNFIPIEEIDNVDYIYKTQEEAENGADKMALFAQQVKENELTLQQNLITARREHETTIHRLRTEAEELKNQLFNKSKEEELKFNEEKRQLEQKALDAKIKAEKATNKAKAKYDKKTKRNESKFNKLKRKFEHESMNEKIDYERKHYGHKNFYEHQSFERDSYIEKLKVTGAVCGVIAGGYLLYKQLNK